jgi:hypothetical protein
MSPSHSSFHQYRIRVIEQWPHSEYQQAVLRAAHSALRRDLLFEQADAGASNEVK